MTQQEKVNVINAFNQGSTIEVYIPALREWCPVGDFEALLYLLITTPKRVCRIKEN